MYLEILIRRRSLLQISNFENNKVNVSIEIISNQMENPEKVRAHFDVTVDVTAAASFPQPYV